MTSSLFKEEKERNDRRRPPSIGYQLMMMVSRTEIAVMSATREESFHRANNQAKELPAGSGKWAGAGTRG